MKFFSVMKILLCCSGNAGFNRNLCRAAFLLKPSSSILGEFK